MRLSVRHLESEYRFHVVGLDLQSAIVALCDFGGDEEPQAKPLSAWTIITALERSGALKAQSLVYLETPKQDSEPNLPETWRLYREKKTGCVAYRLYELVETNA